MAGFGDVKTRSNLREWLNEIAFVASEMSDPSEPQTFQQAWNQARIYQDDIHGNMEKSLINKHSKGKEVGRMPLGVQNQKKWSLPCQIGCKRIQPNHRFGFH